MWGWSTVVHTQHYGFDGSDTSKLKMDSSPCLVISGFWLNVQFLVRSTSRSSVISQKDSSYLKKNDNILLQNPKCLHCSSHVEACQISRILVCHWHIKHHGSTGSFVQNGREAYRWHDPVVKPFLFLGPTQSWQFCESADECTKENYWNEKYTVSKSQWGPLDIMWLLWL